MTMQPTKASLEDPVRPDLEALFAFAETQAGHFTTPQAAQCGYSAQLLSHHTRGGRFRRVRHGIYRFVLYPRTPHEDLMVLWLWTDRAGVISHESALTAQGLAELLPSRTHVTLPLSWKRRRLRVPDGVSLHFADLPEDAIEAIHGIPHTTAQRTLDDCAAERIAPAVLETARELEITRTAPRPARRRPKTSGNWRVW